MILGKGEGKRALGRHKCRLMLKWILKKYGSHLSGQDTGAGS